MKNRKVSLKIYPLFLCLLLLCIKPLHFNSSYANSDCSSPLSSQILWNEWDSKKRLNNESMWIDYPELAPAPSINSEGVPIELGFGENSTFSYGLLADQKVYVYLKVVVGDLNLEIYTNGTLIHNSSHYQEYSEYYSFTPETNENFTFKILHPIDDAMEEAKGVFYIRQQMILAGTKMNFWMNASSENYDTLFLRIDQDFGGINITYDDTLIMGNLSIFHNPIYLERDDYYSFLVYENTYEITFPSELIAVENQKFEGLQTLQWACQLSKFTTPIFHQRINQSAGLANFSGLLPYKPELGITEPGVGFPAGSYITFDSIDGFGWINVTVFPVKGEEMYDTVDYTDGNDGDKPNEDIIGSIPVEIIVIGMLAFISIVFFVYKVLLSRKIQGHFPSS